MSVDAVSGQLSTYSKICRDTKTNLVPGMYQFYLYDGSTAYQYDADSVIFKVVASSGSNVIKYVYEGKLNVDQASKAAVSFQPGRWYSYTAEDAEDEAQSFIDECNANGSVYDGVIVQCQGALPDILEQPAFKSYMASAKTYFGVFQATS